MKDIKDTAVVFFFEDITPESVRSLAENMIKACSEDKEWISLIIFSGGGGIQAGFAAYDIVKKIAAEHGKRIQTIGLGTISSMAIILLMAGEKRIMAEHAVMIFHEMGRYTKDERNYLMDMIKTTDEVSRQQKLYIKTMEEATGLNVLSLLKEDAIIESGQAVANGLIHEIM